MKTNCLQALYLVAPVDHLGEQARARAVGAEDVLTNAVCGQSLAAAIADCRLVVGTSARTRSIPWPVFDPRVCAARLVAEASHGPVALVFGREKTGLTNAELDLCQYVVGIPANPQYGSLNLACAVQVMGYEILRASAEAAPVVAGLRRPVLAPKADVERFYRHLEQVLVEIGFLDSARPRKLMRKLFRLFNRAGLEQNEVRILRGILSAVQQQRKDGTR